MAAAKHGRAPLSAPTHLSLSKSGEDIPAAGFAASGRHTIVCGASGSGKTAAAKVILDHDLAAGRHVVVLDPDDVYGDYARAIATTKALLTYLARKPGKSGIRFVSDRPDDLAQALGCVFNWANEQKKQGHAPQVTLVVDELTVYQSDNRNGARQLDQAMSQIANRGRHRGLWGLWVAQKISQFPSAVLHTARLALVGQHKDRSDWRIATSVFSELDDLGRIANLRPAEFVVWAPGQVDIFTLRAPRRGQYAPIVNPAVLAEWESGEGETDFYAALADTPDEVYSRFAACPAAFDLLADLTGVGEETRAECWQFVEMEHAKRTTAPHR